VTKATKADRTRKRPGWSGPAALVAGLLLATLSGCTSGNLLTQFVPPWQLQAPAAKEVAKEAAKDTPKDITLLRGDERGQTDERWHPIQEKLAAAKQLLGEKKFAEAEKAFHAVSVGKESLSAKQTPGLANPFSFTHKNKDIPEQFREEALFYEAECQRLQKLFRAAEETYSLLVKDYPSSQYTERTDRALFEIALYWLADTRKQMEAYDEQRQGKRWVVLPASFVHFAQDMPLMDAEGHAVRVLEGVQMREKVMHTALGEQALMYLGTIRFYHEDYLDADRHFTDLFRHYPNSKNAARALKQSIICKQLCTGGTMYDLRTVEESRKLIHTAQTAYPEFGKDTDWIQKQLVGINLQQADRDWRVAEFYRWTGHPGPAYFYYELVRRCYPNTDYATKAADRIQELERKHPEAVRVPQAGTLPPGGIPRNSAGTDLPGPAAIPGPVTPRILPPTLAPPTPQ
jgi:outer membrane protein assembly factor BamD (BamD/ComL family)